VAVFPTLSGSSEIVFVIDRSADGVAELIVVVTEELLFPVFGSVGLVADTLAVLVIEFAVVGELSVTVIENVASAPLARLATVQVTVPELFEQPELADTNVTPLGSASVTVTPLAAFGPLLCTASV